MKTVQLEMAMEIGSASSRIAASPQYPEPTRADGTDQLDPAQLDANITIALFRNEHRMLLIAIAVVLAMMAAIVAL